MIRICLKQFILSIGLLLLLSVSYAQEPDKNDQTIIKITMLNGHIYEGYIISDDGREILFEAKIIGKIYLKKTDIKAISTIENFQNEIEKNEVNQYNKANNAGYSTRYHLGSNALPINKGNNFTILNLYGPEIHFAVVDNLTINVATTWIASPITLAVKYTLPLNQEFVHIGIGTRAWTTAYVNRFRGYGFSHWLTATFGNHTDNFSIGFGYGYTSFGAKAKEIEEVGEYFGEQYVKDSGVGAQNIPLSLQTPDMTTGYYFTVGGRKSINKTISLTFDGTFIVGNKPTNYRRITTSQTGDEFITTVAEVEELLSVGYIMPGIRMELSNERAFQFSIFSFYINKNFGALGTGIPLPMFSWYKKF